MFLPETKRDSATDTVTFTLASVEDNSTEITDLAKELFLATVKERTVDTTNCGNLIDECFSVAEIFYLRAERLHITNLEAFEETEKENGTTEEEE